MHILKKMRNQLDMTQSRLAEKAGTSQSTIADYESGKKSPKWSTVERLAKSVGAEMAVSFVPPMTREDLRSLAYHEAIALKLRSGDAKKMIGDANRNLNRMLKMHPHTKPLYQLWKAWLNLPLEQLEVCFMDPNILGRDMRQVTPFAGVLSAKERAQIVAGFRKAIEG